MLMELLINNITKWLVGECFVITWGSSKRPLQRIWVTVQRFKLSFGPSSSTWMLPMRKVSMLSLLKVTLCYQCLLFVVFIFALILVLTWLKTFAPGWNVFVLSIWSIFGGKLTRLQISWQRMGCSQWFLYFSFCSFCQDSFIGSVTFVLYPRGY